MDRIDIIKKIKYLLKDITRKKNILLVKRGNAAIIEVMKLAKILGKEKILIQDQGGWITYKQFANKLSLMCIDIKTDYGLIDFEDLEKKADGKSILILNSLTGYYAEENMYKIEKICNKKHCLLVNDVSGSIGLKISRYGNIILGSFNRWKPINLFKGGFLSFDDTIQSNYELDRGTNKFIQKFFDIKNYFNEFEEFDFKDNDLEKLYDKLKNIGKRHKFFSKKHWQIKKDLKNFQIIHPKQKGINVIVRYGNDEEKNKIIKYCENNHLEYTECPRYIRVNEQAISIEVKRL
jgi:hypothetical protein